MKKRASNTPKHAFRRATAFALAFLLCFSLVPFASADSNTERVEIAAVKAPGVNVGYAPTNLVNGDFKSHPQLWPLTYAEAQAALGISGTMEMNLQNETNRATIDTARTEKSSALGVPVDNWKTTETSWMNQGKIKGLFEWYSNPENLTNVPNWFTNNFTTYPGTPVVEINSNSRAIFYQDLPTQYNDIILWKLDHGARKQNGSPNPQDMEVEIGKANGTPTGENAAITDAAIYTKTGLTGGGGYGYVVDSSNLSGLSIAKGVTSWQTVKGVYIVPQEQTTTRFAFKSISAGTMGNLMSNVRFETLLGNVKVDANVVNDPDYIDVSGYWALVDENVGAKVEYTIKNEGGTIVAHGFIDMADLYTTDPTSDWSARIHKEGLGPGNYTVEVNHSEYPAAKTADTFSIKASIIYDANGGALATDPAVDRIGDYNITVGTGYSVRPNDTGANKVNFAKTGYTFAGWNTQANGGGTSYAPGATLTASDDITLYAMWTANQYNVYYHNVSDKTVLDFGQDSTVIGQNSAAESHDFSTSVAVKNIGEVFTPVFPQCALHGNDCIFLGWDTKSPAERAAAGEPQQIVYTKHDGTPTQFTMPAEDVHLYAVWELETHLAILYHRDAAGASLKAGATSPDVIVVKATADVEMINGADYFEYAKHKFVAWHENSPTGSPSYTDGGIRHHITSSCDTDNDGTVNLYAEWQELWQITYHDKYTSGGHIHDNTYVDTNSTAYYDPTLTDVAPMDAEATKTNLPKVDYVLKGWATSAADAEAGTITYNATNHINFSTITPTPGYNLDLYAVWEPTYHLAYHANGGHEPNGPIPEVTNLPMGASVAVHANATHPTDPYFTRYGYTFSGWSLNADGSGTIYEHGTINDTITVSDSTLTAALGGGAHSVRHVNLYARWEPNSYTLKYDFNGGTGSIPDSTHTILDLITISSTIPTKADHIFLGWNTDPDSEEVLYKSGVAGKENFYIAGDTTLYAIWEPEHGIVYDVNCPPDSTHTGHVGEQSGTAGTVISIQANSFVVPNYTFTGWNTAADGTGTPYAPGDSYTIGGPEILYAQWMKNPIVTFDTKCSVAAPPQQQVVYNTAATDPGTLTRPGYTFTGWYSDAACTTPFDFSTLIIADTTVYAGWRYVGGASTNTLSYVSNGGTTYPAESYTTGTVVPLNKIPSREGYIFIGWYSDAALTTKVTSVTMNGNKTVYAGWKAAEVPNYLNGDDHFAYVIGYPNGTVQPNGNITRAEIATIFFRLLKAEIRDGNLTAENPFSDVSVGSWYNKPVSTMYKLGIVNGRTSTEFAPNAPITRGELATICARFDKTDVDSGLSFSDIANHWAQDYIGHASALGWIMGYPDGSFAPDAPISRAEAMTMINRVLQRLPKSPADLHKDMTVWPDNTVDQWYYLAVQEATNSHDFVRKEDVHESWTAISATPDWMRYEE